MHVRSYRELEPFITLDGSQIREWAGRVSAPAQNQSLAEAIIAPGAATTEHYHRASEELYLVTAGEGRLVVDGEQGRLRAHLTRRAPQAVQHRGVAVEGRLRLLPALLRRGHLPDRAGGVGQGRATRRLCLGTGARTPR
jgi:mannose-6-phosphate isomerase-like protein (cupin superfamily)